MKISTLLPLFCLVFLFSCEEPVDPEPSVPHYPPTGFAGINILDTAQTHFPTGVEYAVTAELKEGDFIEIVIRANPDSTSSNYRWQYRAFPADWEIDAGGYQSYTVQWKTSKTGFSDMGFTLMDYGVGQMEYFHNGNPTPVFTKRITWGPQ